MEDILPSCWFQMEMADFPERRAIIRRHASASRMTPEVMNASAAFRVTVSGAGGGDGGGFAVWRERRR